MDFKIGDDIEVNGSRNRKGESKMIIIIIVVVSLLCGLSVFFVSNALFGKKGGDTPPMADTTVELTDENVQILYKYVTFGTRGTRNDKFLKEQNVTLDSFSNQERFYYALQFAQPEDFANTGRLNEKNQKIYNISSTKVNTYMQRYFGNKVTYSTNSVITYPFSFRINKMNVGTLSYTVESDGYDTVFTELQEDIESDNIVEPYYTELVNATRKADGSMELAEKVIYTEVHKENDLLTINIYKDYQRTMLLETRQNLTKEQLDANPVKIDDYKDKAATVIYTFKLNGQNYYFDNSKITN